MVAVAVQAWRWDQGGEAVDELQRGKGQRGASVALGLGKAIDDLLLPVACRDLLDASRANGGRAQ
jgi:hypothetical protein